MKHLLILISLLLPFTTVKAGWFSNGPDPLIEAKAKITSLENQIQTQSNTLNRWQIASGSLAVGCVLLLILGTALGSKTRQHHHESTSRRLGRTPPPATPLNGRKTTILDEAAEENTHSTLAA